MSRETKHLMWQNGFKWNYLKESCVTSRGLRSIGKLNYGKVQFTFKIKYEHKWEEIIMVDYKNTWLIFSQIIYNNALDIRISSPNMLYRLKRSVRMYLFI